MREIKRRVERRRKEGQEAERSTVKEFDELRNN